MSHSRIDPCHASSAAQLFHHGTCGGHDDSGHHAHHGHHHGAHGGGVEKLLQIISQCLAGASNALQNSGNASPAAPQDRAGSDPSVGASSPASSASGGVMSALGELLMILAPLLSALGDGRGEDNGDESGADPASSAATPGSPASSGGPVLQPWHSGKSSSGPATAGAGSNAPAAASAGGSGKVAFDAGPNANIARWTGGIQNASAVTGLDPYLIGGMVQEESSGNPNTKSRNRDKNTDVGLMQISNERWKSEILPELSAGDRAKIEEVTHKKPEDLDMNNPEDNLIGGSFEIKQKIAQKGGNVHDGLMYYVNGGDPGLGDPHYAENVLAYASEMKHGQKLQDDPAG
jgi:hypothetical protein